MYRRSGLTSLAFSILLLFTLSAQSADPARVQPAATNYIVSGSVTAPGGVIAAHDSAHSFSLARLLDFFVAPAQAGVAGLLPVPNGTRVELVRLGDRGFISAPIAVTTAQYGRYRFNLSALRLTVSSRLVVRVGNVGTGEQMRAFVSGKTVDIDPVSEAAVQMVLHSIAASQNGTLPNFTVRELQDLTGSLDLLTSINKMQAAANLLSSVAEIRTTAAADAGIMRFMAAAAYSGQTNIGPGDIGNFFPFARGQSWAYSVQETEDGIARPPYTTTETITGTRLINGVATTVFRDSNPDGDGRIGYDFNKKTTAGVFDWEPVKDRQMNRPHQFVRFPAVPGSTFSQSLGGMFDTDIDRDGIVERFGLRVTTTVVGLGTVYVPASALPNTLKIRSVITGGATVSSTGKRITLNVTAIEWYTRHLGLSKQSLTYRMTYDGRVWRDTRVQELTAVSGFPFTGYFPLHHGTRLDIKTHDIAYDRFSGKLYASVPSNASRYAGNILVIDPNTETVESAIPVHDNPGPLAISDDGQFLYVGLNGDQAAVLQMALPSMTLGPVWPISNLPGIVVARFPYHIAVQPGNPQVIAVSTSSQRFDGSYSPFYDGTVIMDAGVERPVSTPNGWGPAIIEFTSDPSLAYGFNETSPFSEDLSVLAITPDGISATEWHDDFDSGSILRLKVENDLIYTSSGRVYDAQLADPVAAYVSSHFGLARIEPTAALNRVGILTRFSLSMCLELFDMNSYAKLAEHCMPAEADDYPTNLENVGHNTYVARVHDSSYHGDEPSWLVFYKFTDQN